MLDPLFTSPLKLVEAWYTQDALSSFPKGQLIQSQDFTHNAPCSVLNLGEERCPDLFHMCMHVQVAFITPKANSQTPAENLQIQFIPVQF